MLGLKRDSVQIVTYHADWHDLFEQERRVLHQHIGHLVLDIQHVGSTAVPGLDAKPILDIAPPGIVSPEEDLLSVLVQGEQQGAFTPQEVVANTLLLLAAGHETTINLIGNGLLAFLRHSEQWAVFTHAPRQHAFLATEERLCYDAPVKSFTRIALDEVTYQPTWIVKEHIVPQAILFDLDDTLTDRTQSIVHYAERFQGDFAGYLASTTVSTIAAALLTADVRGYRPREDVVRDFSQRLPWRTAPDVSRLRRHWETCFPLSVVARVGLAETLSTLHARGIRLGIVTNGEVQFQEPKITQLAIGRYLSTVVISEAVQVQKPDPRIFAHALAAIGCAAVHTWFVGDQPINDILGAAAVGLRPIWMTGVQPWPPEHPEPTWQIAALGELVTMAPRTNNAT